MQNFESNSARIHFILHIKRLQTHDKPYRDSIVALSGQASPPEPFECLAQDTTLFHPTCSPEVSGIGLFQLQGSKVHVEQVLTAA